MISIMKLNTSTKLNNYSIDPLVPKKSKTKLHSMELDFSGASLISRKAVTVTKNGSSTTAEICFPENFPGIWKPLNSTETIL